MAVKANRTVHTGRDRGMVAFQDAVVSGLLAMGVGVVVTLVLSLVVPPPLELRLLVAVIAVATFLVGVGGAYAMDEG
jgi:hypothetical protein